MKKIYELKDDVINKDYDLVVMSYGELKSLILSDSELSLREMQLRYDSIAYTEENQISDEDILKEISDTTLKIVQEELHTLYDKIQLKQKDLKQDVNYFSKKLKKSIDEDGVDTLATIPIKPNSLVYQKDVEDLLNRSIDALEIVDKYLNSVNSEDEFVEMYSEFGKYSILVDELSKYHPSNMYFTLRDFEKLENGEQDIKEYKNKHLSKLYSEKYSEYTQEQAEIKKQNYFTKRVNLASRGIEMFPFVIMNDSNTGKYYLLDGFNRLFGNDFKYTDKEVMVKVYKDLDSLEYTTLMVVLNDWKIKSNGFSSLLLDRGFLASLDLIWGCKNVSSFELSLIPYRHDIVKIHNFYKDVKEFKINNITNTRSNYYRRFEDIVTEYVSTRDLDLEEFLTYLNDVMTSENIEVFNRLHRTSSEDKKIKEWF